MNNAAVDELKTKFGDTAFVEQQTKDNIPTLWVDQKNIIDVLKFLKHDIQNPFKMLYDLTAIDERTRINRQGQPDSDFTIVYQLLSYKRNADIRLKVALKGEYPSAPSIQNVWKMADWYEREVYDMFGIRFDGKALRRILMPQDWNGHPLRKEHPSRATEMGPFTLPQDKEEAEQQLLKFHPEQWGFAAHPDNPDYMFLNLGPQHPGTHGVLRLVLQLKGEEVLDVIPDIGYHHRGAEKMGERQSWHTYIPYTDRVDYLSGVVNNLAYLMSVEALTDIIVPDRAKVIRIMLCELFRISNHLVWYGTFAQDIGQMAPVFYMFNDREKLLEIVEAITGYRMHPSWFRIGGTAAGLPNGWDKLVRDFIKYFTPKIKEYDGLVMKNRIIKARTVGIGAYTTSEAVEWGVTGPNLRATGFQWDFRKNRPYAGYDQFEFDIPVAQNGDCYSRAQVKVEEIRQSLKIVEQCLNNMPPGPYKSDSTYTTPPIKDKTMVDIETLINHFLNVSWGPVIPPGEAGIGIEAAKGNNTYYLISDGNTTSYRSRIRTPSFPHMQMVPFITKGHTIADLLAILGAMDFVLADVDR